MKRYIQHEFLKVSHFHATAWEHPVHNHNHVEIIFIHGGEGLHNVNGIDYPYAGKTLFLLGASDYHSFKIGQPTEFTFLKFNNIYLKGVNGIEVERGWHECIDGLLATPGHHYENILKNDYERDMMDKVIRLIVDEWTKEKNENDEPTFFLMQTVMAIIKRNACQASKLDNTHKPEEKITAIVNYIHNHILHTEEINIDHLADMFGYARNYLGIYFKEQTGTTLRDYISQHKLKLIENRLRHSSFSIKEINYEFGFTDLSHFNKFFQKHKGIAPKEFRNQLLKKELSASVS